MAKVTYIESNGEERTVEVPVGATVMDGAADHEIDGIVAVCGGGCSCSTCHVYVEPEWQERVGPPHDAEREILETAIAPAENSRLSCQIVVSEELDGLRVRIPEEQAV
jgi:2Fe-2S ferredoxin